MNDQLFLRLLSALARASEKARLAEHVHMRPNGETPEVFQVDPGWEDSILLYQECDHLIRELLTHPRRNPPLD